MSALGFSLISLVVERASAVRSICDILLGAEFVQASLFGLLVENFLMDQCRSIEANAFVAFEEMRGYLAVSDRRGLVACPKPRRVGLSSSSLLRSQFSSHCSEVSKNREGADLLDLILKKEDFEFEQQSPSVTALMTPFYGGSPPCRADNPLAQDARFRNGVIPPMAASPVFSPSGLLPSPSPPVLKGCMRMKFGPKPAAVRVEGFDCLSRDGQNSSVPAIA